MNIEQAKLLVKGALHVKNVGAMNAFNTDTDIPGAAVCFVCEMRRAKLVTEEQLGVGCYLGDERSFDIFFGIGPQEGSRLTIGDYKNGQQCYEEVKALLTQYGYAHLLEPEEVIPIHVPQEAYPGQFTRAEAGFDWRNPKPVNHVAA